MLQAKDPQGRTWFVPTLSERTVRLLDQERHVNVVLDVVGSARRGTAVQAGGCVGVWPKLLAPHFDTVETFEPHPENWECMMANLAGIHNVNAARTALGAAPDRCGLALPAREQGNFGAWQVSRGDDVSILPLDSFKLSNVSLLYLDVEGFESYALQGAIETIWNNMPVIGLEQKDDLAVRYERRGHDAANWLIKTFGYRERARSGRDVILTPP